MLSCPETVADLKVVLPMTLNPYEAPNTPVRDTPAAAWPAHRRPLWLGLLAAIFAPALVASVGTAVFASSPAVAALSIVGVGAVGVALSAVPAVALGLPAALFLRRIGKLQGAWVCLAAMLAGAAFGAALVGLLDLVMADEEGAPIAEVILRGLAVGVGFGLVSGLAMAVGAGIPFRKPASGTSASR
jgi:hypothetical protein